MKLSTLLLTTTALVVAGSAYAADLPAKKGAPAAKATGCPAFGAGYWQIPGGDTCLKIGGYVRSNNTYTTDTTSRGTAPYTLAGDARITFDARNNSEIGAIASNITLDSGAFTYANLTAGGFTAGRFDSLADIFSMGINSGNIGGNTDSGILYAMPMGASTVTVGVVGAATTWNGTASSRPDLQLGVSTNAGPAAFNIVAVSHEAAGSTSGAYNGWAVLGTAKATAGAATVTLQAGTASGASNYISGYSFPATMRDVSATSGEASTASLMGAKVALGLGTGTLAAFGHTTSVSGASGSTTSLKRTIVGVQYALPVAKGLSVTPEFYNQGTDTGTGVTTSNNIYLRIQRDF